MEFTVSQPQFQGPIETLLSMIEERKMLVSDISLSAIADQYLEHMSAIREYPIGSVTQFVWVAATLVLIKAKSLLPNMQLTEEETADVALLHDRLHKLSVVRKFSKYIETSWGAHPVFTTPGQLDSIVAFIPGNSVTMDTISRIARELITNLAAEIGDDRDELAVVDVPSVIKLEDVMTRIRDVITRGSGGSLRGITDGTTERRSVIITFLALLELARQAHISLRQSGAFDDIQFSPYQMAEFSGE